MTLSKKRISYTEKHKEDTEGHIDFIYWKYSVNAVSSPWNSV